MVSAFFIAYNQIMDVVKLLDILLESEELKDVPQDIIFRVACELITVMSTGECFYKPLVDWEGESYE